MALTQIKLGGLAANSVDSDAYVDGSIDTIHVDDNQVTLAKMAEEILVLDPDDGGKVKLTTSDQRGKAMACQEHLKCLGAIIGKAMTDDENGEVMAIITLQ